MTKQIETRLSDLEKKAIPEGEYQVIVNWGNRIRSCQKMIM